MPTRFEDDPAFAAICGKKGGEIIKDKLGIEHYRKIGTDGGNNLKAARGSEYYAEIGRKGGAIAGIKRSEAAVARKLAKKAAKEQK